MSCLQKNVKPFNMITNKHETKAMAKHISCDCKFNFSSTTWNLDKNGIIKHVNAIVKIIISAKNIIVGILAHVFVRIASI